MICPVFLTILYIFHNMKSFGTQFKSLTANKFAYKALLGVFKTPHVYRVEIPYGASAQCLVGPVAR